MRWTYRAWRNRDISMNSLRVSMFGLAFLSLAALTGQAQTPAEKPSAPLQAIAVLHPTAGNKVSGTVTFTEVADGVQVHAELAGVTAGDHGFHVHECAAGAGSVDLRLFDQPSLRNLPDLFARQGGFDLFK